MVVKIRYIIGIVAVLIIFTSIYYVNSKQNANNADALLYAGIEKILEEEYTAAVDEYSLHPMINGREKEIVLPTDTTTEYYRATIKDEGYDKDLPVDIEVFFATDKEKCFLDDSCFIITEPKDLSSKELKFLNTLIFADNFGNEAAEQDSVYITLKINTVYNRSESIDFDYISTVVFNLHTLEG